MSGNANIRFWSIVDILSLHLPWGVLIGLEFFAHPRPGMHTSRQYHINLSVAGSRLLPNKRFLYQRATARMKAACFHSAHELPLFDVQI